MRRRIIEQIRDTIRTTAYDMTSHAVEEMAEDSLDFTDIEAAILNGKLIKTEKDDPRGTKYTIHGIGTDKVTSVGTIGRFTGTGRYLMITVYKVTKLEI